MEAHPLTLEGWEAAEAALNQHYPTWDSLGREESNLPDRIEPFGPYTLVNLPLDKIPEDSPYETDTESLKGSLPNAWPPIIAPFSSEEEIADGWNRALQAKTLGELTILAYIPTKKAQEWALF